MRVFLVFGMSLSCIFSKVTWHCHVFRNMKSFYEGCEEMCVLADGRRMYK